MSVSKSNSSEPAFQGAIQVSVRGATQVSVLRNNSSERQKQPSERFDSKFFLCCTQNIFL